jgi:hypothetical protein
MADAKLPSFTSSRTANDPEEKYEDHIEFTWTGNSDASRKLKSIIVFNDFAPTYKLEYVHASKNVRIASAQTAPLSLHIHLTNQIVRIAAQYN